MKNKTKIFTTLTLTALLLTGCAANANQLSNIDMEAAKTAAIKASGLSADEVQFHSVELDYRNGTEYYDVDFYANDVEYEYDIDALTGAVLSSKAPEAKEHSFSGNQATANTGNADNNTQTTSVEITAADAKKIALGQVPGAAESDIREFEVDYDDGRLEYEGSIFYNELEYEFEIDGYSGAIRSWEVESIYD